jgi:hypothetical protein
MQKSVQHPSILDARPRKDEIRCFEGTLCVPAGCKMKLASKCLTLAWCAAMVAGCTAGTSRLAEPPAAVVPATSTVTAAGPAHAGEASGKDPTGLTGVWQGQSWANCSALTVDPSRCGAVNAISFTLLQKDSVVSGYYKCAYGNMVCRNMDDTGRVADGRYGSGSSLLTMRVMMPDGSDCLFNGKPRGDRIEGGYLCLQGGGEVERGLWKARRNY